MAKTRQKIFFSIMEVEEEDKTCFICFDSGNLVTMECMCYETFVHEKCILKWLENKDNLCAVCKNSYRNIILNVHPSNQLNKTAIFVIVYMFLALGLGCYMFFQGFTSKPQNKPLLMWGSLCLLVSFVSILTTFAALIKEKRTPQKTYILKR